MEEVLPRLFAIFSNLPYFFAGAAYLERGHGFRAFLLAGIGIFYSVVYHLCIGFPSTCWWSAWKYHVVDFWTAELVIPWTALYFIYFRAPFIEYWLIGLSIVIIGFLVTGTESDFFSQAIIFAVCFLVVIVYVIWYRLSHGYWPPYNLRNMTLGFAFSILAISFFVEQNANPDGYNIDHSFWHVFGGIAQYYFAGMRAREDPMKNLASRITDEPLDSESKEGIFLPAVFTFPVRWWTKKSE